MNQPEFDASAVSSSFQKFVESRRPITTPHSLGLELREACGPWIPVAAATVKAALKVADSTAAGAAVDLVAALGGIGEVQTALLKSIKANTELLRRQPLQTAALRMREAQRKDAGSPQRAEHVKEAIKYLYEAQSVAISVEESAVVQYGLAGAYLALGENEDARYWIAESVQSQRRVLDVLVKKPLGSGVGFKGARVIRDLRCPFRGFRELDSADCG